MLTFHLMFGLCCAGQGECCVPLANGARQHDVALSMMENVVALCHCSVVRDVQLRFICNAMGLPLRSDMILGDILTHINSTPLFFGSGSAHSVDLVSLFREVESVSKHDLYGWCLAHCIYPSGTMRDVRKLLLTHVLSNECHSSAYISTVGCLNMRLQHINSFTDADMSAYPLSILCLLDGVHRNVLFLSLEIITANSVARNTLVQLLQMKLRDHIFSLRTGGAIFHSVMFALHSKENICRLNEIQNTWPTVSDSRLKEEAKIQFEQEILDRSKRKDVCAGCSIAYCSSPFAVIDVRDIDLCPLLRSEGCTVRSSDMVRVDDGPLAEFLLDARGILNEETANVVRMRLCDTCYQALRRSQTERYIVHYMSTGSTPHSSSKKTSRTDYISDVLVLKTHKNVVIDFTPADAAKGRKILEDIF